MPSVSRHSDHLVQGLVSIAEMYKNILASHAIERCVREIELHSISGAKLDWQTGIRCTSLRFGDHHFAKVDTYNPAFGSDEPCYFERIIAGPASNIEHAFTF